jgi:phosphoglycolate phosphatase-like HAD superfamily hydrolase
VDLRPLLVIFDIDGTLVDTTALHHRALTQVLLGLGLDPHSKPWSAYRHYTDSGVIDELYHDSRGVGATAHELAHLDAAMQSEVAAAACDRPIVEIAGARRLLAHLGSCPDVLLGFATGSMRGAAEFKLQALGLTPSAIILSTGSEFFSREHIVRQVLVDGYQRLGREFNAVISGDGVWDERVAHALDIAFVGAETGLHVFGSRANLTVTDWTGLDVDSFRLIARPVSHRILAIPNPLTAHRSP